MYILRRPRLATVVTAPRFVPTEPRKQTHRAARLARLQRGDRGRTAVFTRAEPKALVEFNAAPILGSKSTSTRKSNSATYSAEFLAANVIWNPRAFPRTQLVTGWVTASEEGVATADETQNFTPLRAVHETHNLLDRAARDTPFESRFTLLRRAKSPEFCVEGAQGTTPRREYQEGVVEGVRIRPVPNPYYIPNRRELRQLNLWKSRLPWGGEEFSPHQCYVRGGSRKYSIPEALFPSKDELGEVHPPLLSARYVADVKKQFLMHGLPWLYARDFGKVKTHYRDLAPKIRRRWIRRELRLAKIDQALKSMDTLVEEHRREKKAAKGNSWFEKIVAEMAGDAATTWIRKSKHSRN